MNELRNLYDELSINNLLELISVTSIYFIGVWTVGSLIDNNLWIFYQYLGNKYPNICGKKLFVLVEIILQLVIIIVVSFIMINLSHLYTLRYISEDQQIYMKIAMGIIYAPVFFARQKNLANQLKSFELF